MAYKNIGVRLSYSKKVYGNLVMNGWKLSSANITNKRLCMLH